MDAALNTPPQATFCVDGGEDVILQGIFFDRAEAKIVLISEVPMSTKPGKKLHALHRT